ncbi:MAG: ABC transporter ATP-binding protein [Nocardioidaceae bacterium]
MHEPVADHVLRVHGLTVDYDGVAAVCKVDLTVGRGEVVALLGPSGSGKSTLLHAVAGFRSPSSGEIWLHGHLVAAPGHNVPPERRDVGVVFQNYALWPHLSVLDTVAYPARRRGTGRTHARAEALLILQLLDIARLADRRPAELSGGEQQRVGLARALARRAALSVFDEPTAHLDTHVRGLFLEELRARQHDSGTAALYATHDAEEALGLADRVALLDAGRIIQLGSAEQVYAQPVDLWAATLTGPASVLTTRVVRTDADHCTLDVAGIEVRVGCRSPGLSDPAVRRLLVRPGWARLGGDLPGRLRAVWYRGPHTDHLVDTPVGDVLIRAPGAVPTRVGERLSWSLHRTWALAAPATHGQTGTQLRPVASTGWSEPPRR